MTITSTLLHIDDHHWTYSLDIDHRLVTISIESYILRDEHGTHPIFSTQDEADMFIITLKKALVAQLIDEYQPCDDHCPRWDLYHDCDDPDVLPQERYKHTPINCSTYLSGHCYGS